MSNESPVHSREETIASATEIAVRLGVLGFVVFWCLQIVAPFVGIVAWGLIIAIGAAAPYEAMAKAMGGRRGLAATVFVIIGLSVMVVPAVLLSDTLISGSQQFAQDVADGKMEIPPPQPRVAEWPVIGQPLFDAWSLASENLTAAIEPLGPQLKTVSTSLLHAAGSAGAGLLQLLASLFLAGFLLTRGEDRGAMITKFASRIAGETQGPKLAELARATVTSVVQGIVGVAIVQAVLGGIGFIVADVPGAGLWAMLILVAAIVQLPVALVMIPPIIIVFSAQSTAVAIAFTIWCAAIGLVDNVLKPMLIGRGVELPTLVIFVGAIGGMLSMGIIGLFVGAVVLGVGYELFNAWIDAGEDTDESQSGTTSS